MNDQRRTPAGNEGVSMLLTNDMLSDKLIMTGLLCRVSQRSQIIFPFSTTRSQLSISIKDTCLSVCRLSSVRFPLFIRPGGVGRPRATLMLATRTCTIVMTLYDLCRYIVSVRPRERMYSYNVIIMWVMLASYGPVESPSVCRSST